jgi:hypothetical protein
MDILNVNISNTTGPILAGFVAYERTFNWPHFSIKIVENNMITGM